jgi:hypothetical protein
MSVFLGSRYQNCKFTGILGTDGKVRKFLHAREPLQERDMVDPLIIHSFQQGEVIDEIAWKAVGKPRLWWVIADVSQILFPLEIEVGTELIVPMPELMSRKEG